MMTQRQQLARSLLVGLCSLVMLTACQQEPRQGQPDTATSSTVTTATAAIGTSLVIKGRQGSVDLNAPDGQAALTSYCGSSRCQDANPEPLLLCGGRQKWCFCIGRESCKSMNTICATTAGTDVAGAGNSCGG